MKRNERHKATTELHKVELTGNQKVAPGVHLISFRREFDFLPGQVIKLAVDEVHPPRIYSVCSGINDEEISILFNIKEDGFLTPRLAGMIPGDKVFVSLPYGSFVGDAEPAWWIATGTGIAPFYSMFRSGLGKNKTLIHGVRHASQFYFEDDFDWALGKNYIRCCSQETSCDLFPGRVTNYLESLEEFPDLKYYICGKEMMVVEVRDLLIERGVPFNKILAEIYF